MNIFDQIHFEEFKLNHKHIKTITPSIDLQHAIIDYHPYLIRFIENPCKEIQLSAIKQTGYAIKHIKDPDKEIQLAAVKNDKQAFEYIRNPDSEVKALYNHYIMHEPYPINFIT